MTPLFQQIGELVPKLHGWCTVPKACSLAASVVTLRPDISVEIGVWGGRSLIPIALAHKEIGRGIVWGIDPWDAKASVEGQTGGNLEWWRTIDHELVYRDFMKHVNELNLNDCVLIHRAKSDDVEPPSAIDFLHVDGNHSHQAVKDAERFASKVRVGGFCFMDDISWDGGGVTAAVETIKAMGFVSRYRVDTGEMFQRVK